MKNVVLVKCCVLHWIEAYLHCVESEGVELELLIRIRGRYIFYNIFLLLAENVGLRKCCASICSRAYLRCVEPEGRKSSTLYQNPGSIHF